LKKTLYLFRKPLNEINPAVFLASESQGDVVLLQGSGGQMFEYAGGTVFALSDDTEGDHYLNYDALVKKIFECDRTVVI
jgi:hypothetical protein